MDPDEQQWFHAWCLLFGFMCVFGSVIDIVMIVCLLAIGACLRHNAFVSLVFFSLYMGLAMSKRYLFLFTNYPSFYSLYVGPTLDPILFSLIVKSEQYGQVLQHVIMKVVAIIKNI